MSHQEPEWIDTVSTAERRILNLRSIGMKHALTLGHLHYHRASAPLAEQCHEQWMVLVFLLSGQQRYVIDGEEIGLRGGQMLRIPPGCRYSTGAWPEQKGNLAWLILRVKPFPDEPALGMSRDGAHAVFELLTAGNTPAQLRMPDDAPRLIESAFTWWERRDEAVAREMVRNRIAALTMEAAIAVQPESAGEDQANDLRIRRVLAWLDGHSDDEMPTALEMAAMAGLSPTSFHEHFKRIAGSSPKDYRQRLRVERAARRLREQPALSITEVAHEFGYSSSQYFATVFRRYLGTSPQAYRDAAGHDV
ncbi:AraC family transcriptional regulator [Luteolibacter arcticus]|uniref:AraC family transcriptional regulator n=1 Tax=Luteolibacter arcticus TaxID=1581411 RepID=A0ABT3GFC9_9BACT|nr:AraC family transcriptional regulator [Luteolibacter arcticus]MCW1922264.1 AraC family transcriptional regulator [Luteolibacter arcticus]